jgi:hypothetical protein
MILTSEEIQTIRRLVEAAKPFLSPDVVTETSGTIPLMERLEEVITEVKALLDEKGSV